MLSGKKTYVTGVLAILGFVGAYLTGEMELANAIEMSVAAVLAMTLRHGISTETAKKVAPALLLGCLVALGGCKTSPGGYTPDQVEYDYDWAQETYISTVGNLVALKRADRISQEDWDKTIYPLILEGDDILDAMESAVLAGNSGVLNAKLVTFQAVLQRLKLWLITGEPGADRGQQDGTTTSLTRTGSFGSWDLRPGLGRQAGPARLPEAPQGSSQGAGRIGWRGGDHARAA